MPLCFFFSLERLAIINNRLSDEFPFQPFYSNIGKPALWLTVMYNHNFRFLTGRGLVGRARDFR